MNSQTSFRSKLLIGGAGLAISTFLASVPQAVQAQAFQATPTVVQGTVNIDRATPNVDTIDIDSATAVIDWVPDEISGFALDYLPTGATAIFQSTVQNDFAVLNRILPSTNGDIVVMDGAVISQIDQGLGFVPGGFVAFYSPTGFLIGANATFDVGALMLTTLDPDLASFDSFAAGGTLNLTGQTASTAPIFINTGAQINASPENSFFIAAAAQIGMDGTANINGSTAYIAGEQIDITLSNGLFDIVVPLGTAVGSGLDHAIHHGGTTTGPSSTGIGDNHMIYAVARAHTDPITMLFSGNLGFQPAASAGIVNGEIIISANFDVSGRVVTEGSISDGLNAGYVLPEVPLDPQADVFIQNIAVTSDILAISSHDVRLDADNGSSIYDQSVYVVGRNNARIDTNVMGNSIQIDGDVLVYSDVISGTEALNPGGLNATAGFASIYSENGSQTTINGDVVVTAGARARGNGSAFGNATGGTAEIFANGGTINLNGSSVEVVAFADHNVLAGHDTGGTFTGGNAALFAGLGGTVNILGDALVDASAIGADLTGTSADGGTAAIGGTALVGNFEGSGLIQIGGDLNVFALGIAGLGGSALQGATGQGGSADVFDDGTGSIVIGGNVQLNARGIGASLANNGTGGTGLGGAARIFVSSGGNVTINGGFDTIAEGVGGNGTTGGDGFGGIAGAQVLVGSINLAGSASSDAIGRGGDASIGVGGNGGSGEGGNAFLQADGTLVASATFAIGGNASTDAAGRGGTGGVGDGSTIAAGRGGNGTGGNQETVNQADTNFNSGAFILAGGDNGNISVAGTSLSFAQGIGGVGGDGGSGQSGGDGGDGFGGDSIVGLLFLGGDGSVGLGTANFGQIVSRADGTGGNGGLDGIASQISGTGGSGTGGESFITGRIGTFVSGAVDNTADGDGGDGSIGGAGTGGRAGMFAGVGGNMILSEYFSEALGNGGDGFAGAGGIGTGGQAFIGFQDSDILINGDATVDATGIGGSSDGTDGADGIGGQANMSVFTAVPGVGTVTGHAAIIANGIGGDTTGGFVGGTGTGGDVFVESQAGGSVTLGSAQLVAEGRGGSGLSTTGGNGFGGTTRISADGAGSLLTVSRNLPASKRNPIGLNNMMTSNGVGGATTGGTGVGGSGTGGMLDITATNDAVVTLPLDPANDPEPIGFVRFTSRGTGGSSSVDGGAGGIGTGGTGTISADSGTISVGTTIFSVFGIGGSSADTNLDIDGGDAAGGTRDVIAINGSTITGEFAGGTAGGLAGSGSSNGNGGNGVGGSASVLVDQSTINLIGRSFIGPQSTGGDGNNGGSVSGGNSSFTAINNSTVNILPNGSGQALVIVSGAHFAGNGTSNGGNAAAGDASLTITDSTVNGGSFSVNAAGFGGQGDNGNGGDAIGGNADVIFTNSTINLVGRNEIRAGGEGGDGLSDSIGGDATGGDINVALINSDITITQDGMGESILQIINSNVAGTGDTVGDAFGSSAQFFATNSSLSAGILDMESSGTSVAASTGSAGGIAEGGTVEAIVDGNSAIDVGSFFINANAEGSAGGTAQGGLASLFMGPNGVPTIEVSDTLALVANGSGGDSNGVGRFFIDVEAGTLSVSQLAGQALGDFVPTNQVESSLVAEGGDLVVNTSTNIDVFDDFVFGTGQGSTIGGPDRLNPSGVLNVTSQGAIVLFGDDADFVGVNGGTVDLRSRELDIGSGAVLGANDLRLESLDTDHTMIIGGTTDEVGYTLTGQEAEGIEIAGGTVSVIAPLLTDTIGDPEIILRDLPVSGTLDNGLSELSIFTPGTVRVEGQFVFVDAGPQDVIEISATQRIEVVTPGGIAILDDSGNPTGSLFLSSGDIWVADDDTIGQLQTDPDFTGRNDQLMTAAPGSDDPLGYIRGGEVTIFVDDTLFVRNTGTTEEPGGILVGDGILSIRTDSGGQGSPSAGDEIDVFAYGRKRNTDGSFTTGEEFYDLVNFNQTGTGATTYVAGSEFNDCDINTGECGEPVDDSSSDVPEQTPPVNNPSVVDAAVSSPEPIPPAEEESNAEFGVDFPGLVEAPLLSEDTLLEDPVSSGGDSALYSIGGDEDEEDEEEVAGNSGGENAGE